MEGRHMLAARRRLAGQVGAAAFGDSCCAQGVGGVARAAVGRLVPFVVQAPTMPLNKSPGLDLMVNAAMPQCRGRAISGRRPGWPCSSGGSRGTVDENPAPPLKCTNINILYKMITLPLSEFRANASSTLDLVQQGQTVRIMRHGKPVADLVPVRASAGEVDLPNWKRPFTPVQLPPGVSLAQAVRDEPDGASA